MYSLGNQELVYSQDNPDPQVCQYVEVATIVYNQGNRDSQDNQDDQAQVCQYVDQGAMMDSLDNQDSRGNQGHLVDLVKMDLQHKVL